MTKHWRHIVLIVFCFIMLGLKGWAQLNDLRLNLGFSIPEVAQLDVEYTGSGSLDFEVLPSSNVGASPLIRSTSSEELWVNYSSAIRKNGLRRSIEAQIVNGTLPKGMSLYVQASSYTGTGKGEMGVSTGETMLDTKPNAVIDHIGSCFTGNGMNNGHKLNFVLEINDMDEVNAMEPAEFTILYTITDN